MKEIGIAAAVAAIRAVVAFIATKVLESIYARFKRWRAGLPAPTKDSEKINSVK